MLWPIVGDQKIHYDYRPSILMRSLTSLSCVIFIRDQHAIDRHVVGFSLPLPPFFFFFVRRDRRKNQQNSFSAARSYRERLALVTAAVLFSSALVLFFPLFSWRFLFVRLLLNRAHARMCGYTFFLFFSSSFSSSLNNKRHPSHNALARFSFFGRQDEEKHRLVLARPFPLCSILQRHTHTDIKNNHRF